jgi:hypothetical protein
MTRNSRSTAWAPRINLPWLKGDRFGVGGCNLKNGTAIYKYIIII